MNIFSQRAAYAVQLIADMDKLVECNLDRLLFALCRQHGMEQKTLLQVTARLSTAGIFKFSFREEPNNLYLLCPSERICMYDLVRIVDMTSKTGAKAGHIPKPPEALKEIFVRHLIEAGYIVRDTDLSSVYTVDPGFEEHAEKLIKKSMDTIPTDMVYGRRRQLGLKARQLRETAEWREKEKDLRVIRFREVMALLATEAEQADTTVH